MAHTKRGKALAGVALVIAVVALILSWVAFNRTGTDLNERIETEVNQAVQEVEQAADEAAQEAENEAEQEAVEETQEQAQE